MEILRCLADVGAGAGGETHLLLTQDCSTPEAWYAMHSTVSSMPTAVTHDILLTKAAAAATGV